METIYRKDLVIKLIINFFRFCFESACGAASRSANLAHGNTGSLYPFGSLRKHLRKPFLLNLILLHLLEVNHWLYFHEGFGQPRITLDNYLLILLSQFAVQGSDNIISVS